MNDNPDLNDRDTAVLRGQIDMLKDLMALPESEFVPEFAEPDEYLS